MLDQHPVPDAPDQQALLRDEMIQSPQAYADDLGGFLTRSLKYW
jgi:hypothetical protein